MAKVTVCDLCSNTIADRYVVLEHSSVNDYYDVRAYGEKERYDLHLGCIAPFGRRWEHDD